MEKKKNFSKNIKIANNFVLIVYFVIDATSMRGEGEGIEYVHLINIVTYCFAPKSSLLAS